MLRGVVEQHLRMWKLQFYSFLHTKYWQCFKKLKFNLNDAQQVEQNNTWTDRQK